MVHFYSGYVGRGPTLRDMIYDKYVSKAKTVLVIDDASHWTSDVLENVRATWKWVTKGSYYLIQDTKTDRHRKDGPMKAIAELNKDPKFEEAFRVDRNYERFLYSQHHRGYLKRVK